MSIKVRCPNPDCGHVYAVKKDFAGKKGKCPDCGATIHVPGVRAAHGDKPAGPPPGNGADHAAPATVRREHDRCKANPDAAEVRVGCIGRGHAGKTALFHALSESVVGDFLPSGLHVDATDPREVARLIRDGDETQRLLQQSGLPPTLQASHINYCLYDGDEQQVAYRMREVIGQVLTHTLPDSTTDLQARYAEYLKSLVDTHVLWTVVPCPPADPGLRDRRRFANDLHITLAYLREALRLRSSARPVAVALVLSKIDALFENPEEARAALTDDVLRDALNPLVHLIDKSNRVSDAAIIPVTAFGFRNAVLREASGEREGISPADADDPFASEPIWLLRDGATAQPFNLDTLFLWTLLVGLITQSGTVADGIGRTLATDLMAGDPWLVALKGGTEHGPTPVSGMQGAGRA